MNFAAFFQAWLPACLFWLSLSLGALAILMIHGLTGGAWGQFVAGPLRAAAGTLPAVALLFVPLGFGVEALFPWVREPMPEKSAYLNIPFFEIRTVIYFLIWIGLAAALDTWRRRPSAEPATGQSAAGLILHGLTVSFFAIDWIMSLEPHWYSTAIGFVVAASQVTGGLAFAILITGLTRREAWDEDAIARFQDLGNLLLAGVMFWTYVAFMQYLIIWSGDLPHEIGWYLHRTHNGWEQVGLLLVGLHFVIPFAALCSRRVKRTPKLLMGVAAVVLLGRLLDVWWLVKPAFPEQAPLPNWLDAAALAGVGLVWLTVFTWLLYKQPRTAYA